jgi:hypothetical protein
METHSESRRTGEKGEDFGEQENGREREECLSLFRWSFNSISTIQVYRMANE